MENKKEVKTNHKKKLKIQSKNNEEEFFQVVRNRKEIENVMKDYVVNEDIQKPSSVKKISQKKLRKLEKIKLRKENSLPAKSSATEERTIFVGNVNINTTRNEVTRFFSKYGEVEAVRFRGIAPESMNISKKEAVAKKLFHPSRNSLNAYVRFKEKSSVNEALEANGEIFKDHHIHIDTATSNTSHKDKNSVFVGNLPWEINEENLWQFFESCGKVTNVRLIRSSTTGAGKGFGFISFESDDGVQLALHLNGKSFMKREIRVKKVVRKVKEKEHKTKIRSVRKKNIGANFMGVKKGKSKPMDLSFLKTDKPQLFNKDSNPKSRKRKRQAAKFETTMKPDNFTGIKAVEGGKVIKKAKKKRLNQTERKKRILAKKLTFTKST